MMLAPCGGLWSYLAWINVCALAAVNSGADLHPINNNPAHRSPTTQRMLLFLEIFTFPSVAHTQQLELFRPAIFLQLSAAVNGVEPDAGTVVV
jgi:hypothetical protein